MAFQQQYKTQYADETARVDLNPHKHTMIDLEYFTEELKTYGFEVAVFVDANETLDHRFRSQNHVTSTGRTKDSILTAPSMVPSQHTLTIVV
jgi:hypothetical protein